MSEEKAPTTSLSPCMSLVMVLLLGIGIRIHPCRQENPGFAPRANERVSDLPRLPLQPREENSSARRAMVPLAD